MTTSERRSSTRPAGAGTAPRAREIPAEVPPGGPGAAPAGGGDALDTSVLRTTAPGTVEEVYRDLLADPPAGLRIIAPDLPGYGWSGPPPHRWAKEDVAADLLAFPGVAETVSPVVDTLHV